MRWLMTHLGPPPVGGAIPTCSRVCQDGCSLCSHCMWLPTRALYSICKVTAPSLVAQVGGERTGTESWHRVGAQQTLASMIMSHKGPANYNQATLPPGGLNHSPVSIPSVMGACFLSEEAPHLPSSLGSNTVVYTEKTVRHREGQSVVQGHTAGLRESEQVARPVATCSHLVRRCLLQVVSVELSCSGDTDRRSWAAHSLMEEADRGTAVTSLCDKLVPLGKASDPSWGVWGDFQKNCWNSLIRSTRAF